MKYEERCIHYNGTARTKCRKNHKYTKIARPLTEDEKVELERYRKK